MANLEAKHPGEKEFLQAVHEVLESVEEVYNQHPEFEKAKIVERMVEPDRIFTFRVIRGLTTRAKFRPTWDTAYSSTAPLAPTKEVSVSTKAVNLSMLKFLGFEQTFKNALTTLPWVAAKVVLISIP